jgi:hypothetical protein
MKLDEAQSIVTQNKPSKASNGSFHASSGCASFHVTRSARLVRFCDPPHPVTGMRSERRAVSTDVDHIVPREQGGSDHEDNLQGACHECHSWKTATQDSKFAKKKI